MSQIAMEAEPKVKTLQQPTLRKDSFQQKIQQQQQKDYFINNRFLQSDSTSITMSQSLNHLPIKGKNNVKTKMLTKHFPLNSPTQSNNNNIRNNKNNNLNQNSKYISIKRNSHDNSQRLQNTSEVDLISNSPKLIQSLNSPKKGYNSKSQSQLKFETVCDAQKIHSHKNRLQNFSLNLEVKQLQQLKSGNIQLEKGESKIKREKSKENGINTKVQIQNGISNSENKYLNNNVSFQEYYGMQTAREHHSTHRVLTAVGAKSQSNIKPPIELEELETQNQEGGVKIINNRKLCKINHNKNTKECNQFQLKEAKSREFSDFDIFAINQHPQPQPVKLQNTIKFALNNNEQINFGGAENVNNNIQQNVSDNYIRKPNTPLMKRHQIKSMTHLHANNSNININNNIKNYNNNNNNNSSQKLNSLERIDSQILLIDEVSDEENSTRIIKAAATSATMKKDKQFMYKIAQFMKQSHEKSNTASNTTKNAIKKVKRNSQHQYFSSAIGQDIESNNNNNNNNNFMLSSIESCMSLSRSRKQSSRKSLSGAIYMSQQPLKTTTVTTAASTKTQGFTNNSSNFQDNCCNYQDTYVKECLEIFRTIVNEEVEQSKKKILKDLLDVFQSFIFQEKDITYKQQYLQLEVTHSQQVQQLNQQISSIIVESNKQEDKYQKQISQLDILTEENKKLKKQISQMKQDIENNQKETETMKIKYQIASEQQKSNQNDLDFYKEKYREKTNTIVSQNQKISDLRSQRQSITDQLHNYQSKFITESGLQNQDLKEQNIDLKNMIQAALKEKQLAIDAAKRQEKDIYDFLKDFFQIDPTCTNNLSVTLQNILEKKQQLQSTL